ncbi:MAG TPA: (2Fe-2S)-binding protein [Methylomirabilota bacterium]|jgi:bacterioferritin-associated ferredoxin|nr:(2Fe-2S)-binding protein [Methylomirabilota bacterium]
MIVCLCRGVADRAIGAAIADGASTLTDIVAACAAGSDCGACHASLLAMLAGSQGREPATACGRS